MSAADHSHDFEFLDCGHRGAHGLKAPCGLYHSLERARVRLNDVVELLGGSVLRFARYLAIALESGDRLRIRGELICCDRRWRPVAYGRHGFAQEALCRAGVAPFQEHEVDQAAVFVNCTEQVLPSASVANFCIGRRYPAA